MGTLFSKSKAKREAVTAENKLQRLAIAKGFRTGYEFAKAVEAKGITSYSNAFRKWQSGKIEKTEYPTVKGIADLLGASIEDVFDP